MLKLEQTNPRLLKIKFSFLGFILFFVIVFNNIIIKNILNFIFLIIPLYLTVTLIKHKLIILLKFYF